MTKIVRETTGYTKRFWDLTSIQNVYDEQSRKSSIREEIEMLEKMSFTAYALMKYLKSSIGHTDTDDEVSNDKLSNRYRDALKLIKEKASPFGTNLSAVISAIREVATKALYVPKPDNTPDMDLILAHNPKTMPEVLDTLSKHSDVNIRRAVAINVSTPSLTIDKLLDDPREEVRAGIAFRTTALPGFLRKLSVDKSGEVRHWVAVNTNTPIDVLNKLTDDPIKEVREFAKNTLEKLIEKKRT